MTALEIIDSYISFFEKRGHKRIPNSPLVPENDPTTLFTSSGMQPLLPYFLGEPHPLGKRLVNIQNCFRAADIDNVGDNRHTTFFRMLGNWSFGDYFKKEQLTWFFEFLTKELGLSPQKLYVSVFLGYDNIPSDEESVNIWKNIFQNSGINPKEHIFSYDVQSWWSRSGEPNDMPQGEPGGPDSEVFFDFGTPHDAKYGKICHPNCQCPRFLEIGNSVFMQYKKSTDQTFKHLPNKNVDFGGGLERLLAAVENQQDIFQTTLLSPIVKRVEKLTDKSYREDSTKIRIIADHLIASSFIIANGVWPSNKESGYILRRLIRRALDNFYRLEGGEIVPVIEQIIEEYKKTDPDLVIHFEKIKNVILEEEQGYKKTLEKAKTFISKKYEGLKEGDELMGVTKISAGDAFLLYSTHGLSPTQIKSLGYVFDEQEFARKMEEHQKISRKGAEHKFKGGLADTSEKTVMGHTATHLLHKALKDVLGENVHQAGSNITSERVRFDFNFDRKLTAEEIKKIEDAINQKIKENLPVNFKIMSVDDAKKIGAIGLFDQKYEKKVKVYFIADSVEICGGPHVDFTGQLKRFKIIKQENIGHGNQRIYAKLV